MSNIKNILAENDELVQSNGSLSHDNSRMEAMIAVYADAIQLAVLSIRAGRSPDQIAIELEAALSPGHQKRLQKVEPAA